MKTFYKTPLALAIAALVASPLVLADDSDAGEREQNSRTWENEIEVELEYDADVEKDYDVEADVYIDAWIDPEAYSSATVDSKQLNSGNYVDNNRVDNDAVVNGNALQDAAGNIGVNTAAGDNNMQANDAALAAVDAGLVFAHANAYSLQVGHDNETDNRGVVNNATLGGNALQNAAGNIGVNIAAGDSNLQQNTLAASVNTSGNVADATVAGMQQATDNHTTNDFVRDEITTTTRTSVSGTLSGPVAVLGFGGYAGSGEGSYAGTSDQIGDVYPDTWGGFRPGDINNDGDHGCCQRTGHFDLDTETQGGSDLNDDGGALAFNEEGELSFDESGHLGFIAVGGAALSGTLSGTVQHTQVIYIAHENNAHLGGNALQNAAGNIGVNIAAGTNNMQRNSLAIAAATGPGQPGGGGNGGGGGG